MRYRFIQAEKAVYPVGVLCRVLDVARSGFYAWCQRPMSLRAQENQRPGDAHSGLLSGLARPVWKSPDSSRPTGPRTPGRAPSRGSAHAAPWALQCQPTPGLETTRNGRTGDCGGERLAPSSLSRRGPNQKWAGDITYVPTRQGWLYVAVLMDLYSRRIVGWAMDDQATTTLTLSALEMALQQRSVPVGLLHHSDRGSQYGAVAYQHRLAACGIQCSMSRPGNCWDNAVVESFFATLKTELLVNAHPYPTRQDVRTAIFEYVEGFYNRSRRHSTLGYLSPVEFEQRAAQSTSGVH